MCFVHLAKEISSSEAEAINGEKLDGNSLTIEIARQRNNVETTPKGGKGDRGTKNFVIQFWESFFKIDY